MRIAFVGPTIEENLAIGYLAAALRAAGHETITVPFADDRRHAAVATALVEAAPDLVALGMSFQCRAAGYLALVAELRAAGHAGHVVAGGHFAALAADALLARGALSSVLVGEAEESIVALADALARGGDLASIPGIVLPGGVRGPHPRRPADLDRLPFPVRDRPPATVLGVPVAPLVASRGCRGRCAYCSIAAFARLSTGDASGRRERSIDNVADEMEALWRDRGVRVFVFHDDDFLGGEPARDRARARALGAALAARGLPRVALAIKARPDDIDPGVLDALVEAGLVRVFLGVETAAPAGLRALGRGVAPGASGRALALLADRGLLVSSNLLLWEPGTTLDDLRANLALCDAFPRQLFDLARVEPYEGAPFTLRLARQGRLLGDLLARDYRVVDPRAEAAWQRFRDSLGERCYALDGVVKRAGGLAVTARVGEHLFPSPRMARLAAAARALVAEVAASNRRWLGRVIDGDDPASTLLRAIRAEDARLVPALDAARADLERAARGEPRRRATRALRLAVVAAGTLACGAGPRATSAPPPSQAGGGGGSAPGSGRPDAAPPDAAPPDAAPAFRPRPVECEGPNDPLCGDAAGVPPPRPVLLAGPPPPPSDASPPPTPERVVPPRLQASPVGDPGRRCRRGVPRHTTFELEATLPGPGRIERFVASDGTILDTYFSPDGRRAHARLSVGERRGVRHVSVEATLPGRRRPAVASVALYQYGGGEATLGRARRPRPECGYPPGDPAPPPPPDVFASDGEVVLAAGEWTPAAPRGWARRLELTAALRATVAGKLEGVDATCEAGTMVVGPGRHRKLGGVEVRDPHLVVYDPRPPDGSGRLREGEHACVLRFRLTGPDGPRLVEARLRAVIRSDGEVTLTR